MIIKINEKAERPRPAHSHSQSVSPGRLLLGQGPQVCNTVLKLKRNEMTVEEFESKQDADMVERVHRSIPHWRKLNIHARAAPSHPVLLCSSAGSDIIFMKCISSIQLQIAGS